MELTQNELAALRDYQGKTSKTAIYPDRHAVSYLTLGLFNELAEFVNAENPEIATAEVGDIWWFLSQMANLIGTDLGFLIQVEDENYHKPDSDASAVSLMFGELADISGSVAKHLRDGSDYHYKMRDFLTLATQYTYTITNMLSNWIDTDDDEQTSLEAVLQANIAKLLDRQQRGVLGGSGDKR